MAEASKIQWTDHTFNPWIGCTKVSPGCTHCYAEAQNNLRKWNRDGWGKGVPRKRTSEGNWKLPLRWNREASSDGRGAHYAATGEYPPSGRPRVFCASLADWLDDEVPLDWLWDLIGLIHNTPNLDWLLLTKRPENFFPRMRDVTNRGSDLWDEFIWQWTHGGNPPANVWVGTTVEDGPRKERLGHLRSIPARVRFLSCEPLIADLGYIDLRNGIDWVICGGESGPKARPADLSWFRSLLDQCNAAGVAFFMKQLGGVKSHRGELSDFPEDLRIREFPGGKEGA